MIPPFSPSRNQTLLFLAWFSPVIHLFTASSSTLSFRLYLLLYTLLPYAYLSRSFHLFLIIVHYQQILYCTYLAALLLLVCPLIDKSIDHSAIAPEGACLSCVTQPSTTLASCLSAT